MSEFKWRYFEGDIILGGSLALPVMRPLKRRNAAQLAPRPVPTYLAICSSGLATPQPQGAAFNPDMLGSLERSRQSSIPGKPQNPSVREADRSGGGRPQSSAGFHVQFRLSRRPPAPSQLPGAAFSTFLNHTDIGP
jgi:hypothetical protein